MKEVLFKSEELIIVADSESKVVYGTTTRNEAVKYLNSLTPKNADEVIGIMGLCLIILTGKYVLAKHVSIVNIVEVTVKAAKPSVVKTAEDAIRIASKFNLEAEVQRELDNGATPLEALREWDII